MCKHIIYVFHTYLEVQRLNLRKTDIIEEAIRRHFDNNRLATDNEDDNEDDNDDGHSDISLSDEDDDEVEVIELTNGDEDGDEVEIIDLSELKGISLSRLKLTSVTVFVLKLNFVHDNQPLNNISRRGREN